MPFFTFTRDSIVPTLLGWTPGLRSLTGSRVLPCECLTGTYTTWRGDLVVILDARGAGCLHAHHRTRSVLWRRPAGPQFLAIEEPSSYADRV